MKDFLGKELEVGDRVVYIQVHHTARFLCLGTVIGFTEEKIKIQVDVDNHSHFKPQVVLKEPKHVHITIQ